MNIKKFLFLIFLTLPTAAFSYETANYKVVKKISDKVEIREYQELLLAKITVGDASENKSFRSLFKFISGKNDKEQEIKMTTPVFQESAKNQQSMSFIMPANFQEKTIPQPDNKNIKIESIKNAQFIVIRFSGRAVDKNFAKYQNILQGIIKENGIGADLKNPIKAYYNPPWTLPFLKRNEVLFLIKS
jgi:hypothetical protein